MSLIVKGISLPRSCSTCRFSYFTVGIKKRCEISGDEVNPLIDHRDINCPLSELPTPHGRLIDAEELLIALTNDSHGLSAEQVITIMEFSTIIEAEVSE